MATIIFDFDGTIADSFDYVTSFLNRSIRGGQPLTTKEKQALRGLSMEQMAQSLGSSRCQLPLLFVTGRYQMGKAIYNVPIFAGIAKVIEQLHGEGHQLMIVSSNNNRNIRKSLRQHHLYKYFTDIYGNAGFFGKKRALRRIMRRNSVKPGQALYIGDEARDITAAHAAGVRVIAADWGFDNLAALQAQQPTAIAAVPSDITRLIEGL